MNKYVLLMIAVGFSGCAGWKETGKDTFAVLPLTNATRAAMTWSATSFTDATHRQRVSCLEFATPVTLPRISSTSANANTPANVGAGVGGGFEHVASETSAQVYSVGEIMQFAHEALYRLCEAFGNGAINPDTYSTLFNKTVDSARDLIQTQIIGEKGLLRSQLTVAKQKLGEIEQAIKQVDAQLNIYTKDSRIPADTIKIVTDAKSGLIQNQANTKAWIDTLESQLNLSNSR